MLEETSIVLSSEWRVNSALQQQQQSTEIFGSQLIIIGVLRWMLVLRAPLRLQSVPVREKFTSGTERRRRRRRRRGGEEGEGRTSNRESTISGIEKGKRRCEVALVECDYGSLNSHERQRTTRSRSMPKAELDAETGRQ